MAISATCVMHVSQVDLQQKVIAGCSPSGKGLGHSIDSLTLTPDGELMLGTADGSVHVMRTPSARAGLSASVASSVASSRPMPVNLGWQAMSISSILQSIAVQVPQATMAHAISTTALADYIVLTMQVPQQPKGSACWPQRSWPQAL